MNEYFLNLDIPPKSRWLHIGKDYSHHATELQTEVRKKAKEMLGDLAMGLNKTFILYYKMLTRLAPTVNKLKDYWDEMSGLALGLGIGIDTLIFLNYGYDYSTKCTAALVRHPMARRASSLRSPIFSIVLECISLFPIVNNSENL